MVLTFLSCLSSYTEVTPDRHAHKRRTPIFLSGRPSSVPSHTRSPVPFHRFYVRKFTLRRLSLFPYPHPREVPAFCCEEDDSSCLFFFFKLLFFLSLRATVRMTSVIRQWRNFSIPFFSLIIPPSPWVFEPHFGLDRRSLSLDVVGTFDFPAFFFPSTFFKGPG